MSWLFGIKSTPPPLPPPSDNGGDSNNNNNNNNNSNNVNQQNMNRNTESQYRFDSAALERAAKAAKDLEKSVHAKDLLELSRVQEKTKQMEIDKQIKEMQTYQEELKANASQKLMEEKRKLLDEETRHNNEVNIKYIFVNGIFKFNKLNSFNRELVIKISWHANAMKISYLSR
jgi:ATPase family AAA domain-containing protein 3A/B